MEIKNILNQRPNVNVNKNNINNVKRYNVKDVERTARRLADKLQDDKSFLFFCKVGYQLSESQIWATYEQAIKNGRNPRAYFASECKRQMSEQ